MSDKTREARIHHTKQEVLKAMNSVCNLKFTIEDQTEFSNGWVPTLDMEWKMDSTSIIRYRDFDKPMKRPTVIAATSAIPENTKNAILTQELVRKLLNCDQQMTPGEKCEVVNNFTDIMLNSGYDWERVKLLTTSTLTGHDKRVQSLVERGGRTNRSRAMMMDKRRLKKWVKKTSWFKEGKEEDGDSTGGEATRKVEMINKERTSRKKTKQKEDKDEAVPQTVMFVPRTQGGVLMQKLRQAEEQLQPILDTKVRLVERCGVQLAKLLIATDPWQPTECDFTTCQVCKEPNKPEDNPKCNVRGITYSNKCLTCKEEGNDCQYIGESSRTLREHYGEHLGGREADNNHMTSHEALYHQGEPALYAVKVLASYKTPIDRQIAEAVKIKLLSRTSTVLMNNKMEYNAFILPELCTIKGENIKMTQEEEEKMKEEKIEMKKEEMKRKAIKMLNKNEEPAAKKIRRHETGKDGGTQEEVEEINKEGNGEHQEDKRQDKTREEEIDNARKITSEEVQTNEGSNMMNPKEDLKKN